MYASYIMWIWSFASTDKENGDGNDDQKNGGDNDDPSPPSNISWLLY